MKKKQVLLGYAFFGIFVVLILCFIILGKIQKKDNINFSNFKIKISKGYKFAVNSSLNSDTNNYYYVVDENGKSYLLDSNFNKLQDLKLEGDQNIVCATKDFYIINTKNGIDLKYSLYSNKGNLKLESDNYIGCLNDKYYEINKGIKIYNKDMQLEKEEKKFSILHFFNNQYLVNSNIINYKNNKYFIEKKDNKYLINLKNKVIEADFVDVIFDNFKEKIIYLKNNKCKIINYDNLIEKNCTLEFNKNSLMPFQNKGTKAYIKKDKCEIVDMNNKIIKLISDKPCEGLKRKRDRRNNDIYIYFYDESKFQIYNLSKNKIVFETDQPISFSDFIIYDDESFIVKEYKNRKIITTLYDKNNNKIKKLMGNALLINKRPVINSNYTSPDFYDSQQDKLYKEQNKFFIDKENYLIILSDKSYIYNYLLNKKENTDNNYIVNSLNGYGYKKDNTYYFYDVRLNKISSYKSKKGEEVVGNCNNYYLINNKNSKSSYVIKDNKIVKRYENSRIKSVTLDNLGRMSFILNRNNSYYINIIDS